MSAFIQVVFFILSVVFASVVLTGNADASRCDCNQEDNELYEDQSKKGGSSKFYSVFSGRVEEVRFFDPYDFIAKVKVIDMYHSVDKNLLNSEYLYVGSTLFDNDCGMELIVGNRYLFRVQYHNSIMVVDGCETTKHLQKVSKEEIQALGKPVASYPDSLSSE